MYKPPVIQAVYQLSDHRQVDHREQARSSLATADATPRGPASFLHSVSVFHDSVRNRSAALRWALEFAGGSHGLCVILAGAGRHRVVCALGTESSARRPGLHAATLPLGEPAQRLTPDNLPVAWWSDNFEPLRAIGHGWIREKSSLAIEVPSAALRVEWNVLVNPLHPNLAQIKAEAPQPFHFDARMFR